MSMRIVLASACALVAAGCVTTETVRFTPQENQQLLLRDGHHHVVSRTKNTIVGIRPATRQIQPNARPIYILNIQNTSRQPLNFLIANVTVEQLIGTDRVPLQVLTHSELETEEKNRQTARVILAAVAAGANSASVANRGYWAQAHAQHRNEVMMQDVSIAGQHNLAALEALVIKDHTVMPGEHYGGQIHVAPPEQQGSAKNYLITVVVGQDRHEFRVTQAGGS
jgi:hypothetical protein